MRMNKSLISSITATAALALMVITAHGGTPSAKLVVCSPGSPGTTDEAQPRMDALAKAISAKAGTAVTAVYDPTDDGGVSRLKTAELGMVSLPFFLQHEQELGLHARLQPVAKDHAALEKWALVVQKGKVKGPEGLAGFTIMSSVGFSPAFVRGVALGGFGPLPATVQVKQSTAVLSSLRHAADGEPVAVLLDSAGEASLASLPFGAKLEVVAHSAPVPAGVIVSIDARVPDKAWAGVEKAMLGLSGDKASAATLDALMLTKFMPLDTNALSAAKKSFTEATK